MPKISLIPPFLKILHFKESYNLIRQKHFGPIFWKPEFGKIRDLRWYLKNNTIFHFRLFPGKTNFSKNAKSTNLGPFWYFLRKAESLLVFLILTKYHRVIIQKKTNDRIPSNTCSRLTHGWTRMNKFIGPFWLKPRFQKTFSVCQSNRLNALCECRQLTMHYLTYFFGLSIFISFRVTAKHSYQQVNLLVPGVH